MGMFLIKHFIADFLLQSQYILQNRRHFGHPGGLLHVGIHGATSVVVLVLFGTSWAFILAAIFAEMVFHYHLDWLKDNFTHRRSYGPADSAFWLALGADQMLHQLSYVLIVMFWIGCS